MPEGRTARPRKAKKAVMVADTVRADNPPAAVALSPAAARFAEAVAAATARADEPAAVELALEQAEPAVELALEQAEPAVELTLSRPAPTSDPAEADLSSRTGAATPIFGRRGTGLASRRAVTPVVAPPAATNGPGAAPVTAPASTSPRPAGSFVRRFLATIDALPPIKLPIGGSIPWRFGLPGLVALVLCMALLSRPTAHAQTTTGSSFKLPADTETYAVTQDSPLFADSQAAAAQKAAEPIGVAEPPGLGLDIMDLTLKLVAVLALAYGSLALLKKARLGGRGGAASGGMSLDGLRVISTLALAPNRSVHVVRAPGGKTLLVGATPGQVNLIADLGQVPDSELSNVVTSSTFFDVLASKLNPSS